MAVGIYVSPGIAGTTKPPADNGARGFVTSGFSTAQGYASTSMNSAVSFLNQLGNAANSLQLTQLQVAPLMPNPPNAFSKPQRPLAPAGVLITTPAAPTEPALADIAQLALPAAPEFSAVPLPLTIPSAPPALTATAPLLGALLDVAVPDAPTITLPDVPTLLGINIPGMPVLNLPSFAGTLAAAPTAPANTFAFVEPAYTSSLLDSLRARLAEWVAGAATGLAPAVEQALWERGRAREHALLARKTEQVVRDHAQRGFAKPAGALALALGDALQDTQGTLSGLSREIMVKQAELEQGNRQFAFETAFKVESELITYQNLVAQRGFEVARYAQQVAIDVFHELVLRYQADIAAYEAQANVFKTLIEAELAKLEVFKATLEGQKLIGELNAQSIALYQARITGALANVELFKSRVQAANMLLEGNKIRIEGFAATVSAYDATVRAKAAEYQGYATAVQAEALKVDIFKGQAEAFRSQAEAFRSTVEAAVARKNSEIEVSHKLPLDLFKVRTDVYRTFVDAETARSGALLRVYETNAHVFSTEVQAEAARTGSDTDVFKSRSDSAVAAASLQLQAAKETVQLALQKTSILTEAIKGGAQVSAQVAAAALSAINLSAQLSDHNSNSASNSSSDTNSNQKSSQIGDMTHHNISSKEGD